MRNKPVWCSLMEKISIYNRDKTKYSNNLMVKVKENWASFKWIKLDLVKWGDNKIYKNIIYYAAEYQK